MTQAGLELVTCKRTMVQLGRACSLAVQFMFFSYLLSLCVDSHRPKRSVLNNNNNNHSEIILCLSTQIILCSSDQIGINYLNSLLTELIFPVLHIHIHIPFSLQYLRALYVARLVSHCSFLK